MRRGWTRPVALAATARAARLRASSRADRSASAPRDRATRAGAIGAKPLVEHERGWASIDRVWHELDRYAADYVLHCQHRAHIRAVYGYEDCALKLFQAAEKTGAHRVYDLPIAYWELARRLLHEEAERYPDWEPTLGGTRDSHEKLARKTQELELADSSSVRATSSSNPCRKARATRSAA
jgi:hypothetical protein